MKEKIIKFAKNRKFTDIIIIIFCACIIGIPLLYSELNVYYDDGIQHIARAYGTYISNSQSKLFNNVIFTFSNSYGYSWNLFYGPLSCIGINLFNLLCNNFIVAYKLFVFVCLFLSGIFMYMFVKKLVKNNNVALLSAILYITFPYHLTDLYTRNALGEYVSFIFIPLVFLGIYNLFYDEKKSFYITLGAVGLILTHNLSTIIVAIFSLIYFLLNVKNINKKVIINLVLNIIFIVLITSFFWVPMIETKLSANYQVYEEGMMSTSESVANSGLTIKQLFVTLSDGSYVFELGPHIIIMLAFSFFTFKIIRKDLKLTYGFCLISGFVAMWMSTKYFPWKYLPEQFSIIQFSWRMLMMSAFFFSIVCAINMFAVIKRFNYKDVFVISIISMLYIMAIFNLLIKVSDGDLANIEDIDLGKFSGREIETVAGCGKGEYLTSNAYNNRFYIVTRENAIYVLKGKAIIENENKDGGTYTAKLETLDADYTVFEMPYIYYPGYTIKLDGIKTSTFETENGLLGFVMGKDDTADLELTYTGTKAMHISLIISIISCIGFLGYNLKCLKSLKKEEK